MNQHVVARAIRKLAAGGFACLCACLGLMASAPMAQAGTITVTSNADSGAGTLREAVSMAGPSDTIVFSPTLAGQTIVLTTGTIGINKALTIDGSAAPGITVDGNNASRVFSATAPLGLNALIIQNGRASDPQGGGGLHTSSALTITNTQFLSNTSTNYGGAIGIRENGDVTVSSAAFINNRAAISGGAIDSFGHTGLVRVVNTLMARNSAPVGGAGLNVQSTSDSVQVLHTTIASPTLAGGSAVFVSAGAVNITDTVITSHTVGISRTGGTARENFNYFFGNGSNTSVGVTSGGNHPAGPPLFANPAADDYRLLAGHAAIDTGTNVGVAADFFGALRPQGAGFDIGYHEACPQGLVVMNTLDSGCNSLRNTVAFAAAGQTVTFSPTLAGQTILLTTGEIAIAEALTIDGSAAPGVKVDGGNISRIFYASTPLSLNALIIQNGNAGGGDGGALRTGSALTITNTQFLSNTANYGGAIGIYGAGDVALNGATFINNRAVLNGGAIDTYLHTGLIRLINTLMARNSGTSGGSGLNLESPAANVQVLHTTIASPTLAGGSAVFVSAGTVNITDTVIASHTFGINRTGGTVGENYNYFFGNGANTSGSVTSGGNHPAGAPLFANPAADDYRLLAGHAAIDTGTNVGVATDFFGTPRPQGAGFDIGYHEKCAQGLVVLSAQNAGCTSLRDTVAFAAPGQTVSFAPALAGQTILLTTGEIAITKALTIDGSAAPGVRVDGGNISRIFYATAPLSLNALVIQNGYAVSGGGGGIRAFDTLAMTNTRILSSTASGLGGGVYAGTATLNGGLFQNNRVTGGDGGGLFGTYVTVTGTQFISNTAANSGGGMRVTRDSTVQDARFERNTAGVSGGGLSSQSALVLSSTLFIANTAASIGGGFHHDFGAVNVRIVNSLFARNTAPSGAGLAFTQNADATLLHTTIASPTVAGGSAVRVSAGTLNITDTIITSHTVGISRTGGTVNENYNYFFGNGANTSGSVTSGANHPAGAPAFINPGADDYRLLAGHPAVDTGTNVGVATDFFGAPRPQGAGFDIGYYEKCVQQGLVVLNTQDAGCDSLRDVVAFAAAGQTVTFAPVLAGQTIVLTTGEIAITRTLTIDGSAAPGVKVDGNNAGRIFYATAPLSLNALIIQNGNVDGAGGGIYVGDALAMTNTRILSSTASGLGGGLAAAAATLNGGLFQNNRSTGFAGGGLYADSAAISGTHFISNTAAEFGGGARVGYPLTVQNARFERNRADSGGGLSSYGDPDVSNTLFIANTAATTGGGFHHDGSGFNVRVVNSLFARNSAPSGAGLAFTQNADATLLHTTIASPTVAGSSAVQVGAGTLNITDTIITSHTVGINRTGGTVNENYNYFFGNGAPTAGGVTSGVNHPAGMPGFANPALDDYHIGPISAARNTGVNAGVFVDFEGDARPKGAGFDIGYDEMTVRVFVPSARRDATSGW